MKDKNVKEFFNEIVPDTSLEYKTMQKIEARSATNVRFLRTLRISIISCAFFVVALLITLSSIRIDAGTVNMSMKSFSSHNDFKSYVKTHNSEYLSFRNSLSYNPLSSCFFGCSSQKPDADQSDSPNGESSTNLQVEGVDEADVVKNNSRYIFTVSGVNYGNSGAINIFDTATNTTGKIEFTDITPQQIFLTENILTVLGKMQRSLSGEEIKNLGTSQYHSYYYHSSTVQMFDVTNPFSPKMISNYSYPHNSIVSARIVSNSLYLIMQSNVLMIGSDVVVPSYEINGEKNLIAPENLYAEPSSVSAYVYTNIATLNVKEGLQVDIKSFFGSATTVYSNKTALYTSSRNTDYQRNLLGGVFSSSTNTTLNRFTLSETGVIYHSGTTVEGFLINQFAMDERDNYFSVATTLLQNKGAKVTLYSINENLMTEVSFVSGMGAENNERIYSVRFEDNLCYLVTARNTDPLYIIDLSDKLNPTVLSELKIPDVSDYMHSFNENTIIGIGRLASDFGFNGVQTSLFDVSDKTNPKLTSQISFGNNTSSPIQSNHKALLYLKYSDGSALYGFPITDNYNNTAPFFPIISTDGSTLKYVGNIAISGYSNHIDSSRGIIIGNKIFVATPSNISISALVTAPDLSVSLAPTTIVTFS